jgi:hypothetical protein
MNTMSIHTPLKFSFWRADAMQNAMKAKVLIDYCLFRRWIT